MPYRAGASSRGPIQNRDCPVHPSFQQRLNLAVDAHEHEHEQKLPLLP